MNDCSVLVSVSSGFTNQGQHTLDSVEKHPGKSLVFAYVEGNFKGSAPR